MPRFLKCNIIEKNSNSDYSITKSWKALAMTVDWVGMTYSL